MIQVYTHDLKGCKNPLHNYLNPDIKYSYICLNKDGLLFTKRSDEIVIIENDTGISINMLSGMLYWKINENVDGDNLAKFLESPSIVNLFEKIYRAHFVEHNEVLTKNFNFLIQKAIDLHQDLKYIEDVPESTDYIVDNNRIKALLLKENKKIFKKLKLFFIRFFRNTVRIFR
jgi:hypothetical protein